MEHLLRNFLWSEEQSRSRRSQISWDVVCLPTKEGGLGSRPIHQQNEAFFIKLGWIAASSSSLWADWMTCRYFPKFAIWSPITPKSGSCIWQKIRNLAHHIPGSQWIIRNGKQVDVWYDSGLMLGVWLPFPINKKLSTFWEGNNWIIPSHIPLNVAEFLWRAFQKIHLQLDSVDILEWKSHPGKALSFKEACQLTRSSSVPLQWASLVWNSLLQPRVSCFAWRLMHGRTPTQDWAQSIGFNLAPRCCLCNNNPETALHLLFLCPFASTLWQWILSTAGISYVPPIHPFNISTAGISYVPPIHPFKIWQDLSFHSDKLARKGASSILFTNSYHLMSFGSAGMLLLSRTLELLRWRSRSPL